MIAPATENRPFPMAWQTRSSFFYGLYQTRIASRMTKPCFST